MQQARAEKPRGQEERETLRSRPGVDFSQRIELTPGQKDPGGARFIAHMMDDLVRVPGTKITVGFDALLSLIPGLGSSAGTIISGAILIQAIRQRVPLAVLARMILNLIFDWILGQIPAVGALADFAFRSNRRNVHLLEREALDPAGTKKASIGYVILALIMVLGAVIGLVVLSLLLLWGAFQLLPGR